MSRINPKAKYRTLVTKAANYVVTRYESESVFRSTVNAVQFSLPDSGADANVVGSDFDFECVSNTCTIVPSGADTINYKGSAYAVVSLNAASDRVRLFCSVAGQWDLIEYTGNPSLDATTISDLNNGIYVLNATPYTFNDFNISAIHVLRTATGACAITIDSDQIASVGRTFTIKDTGLNAIVNNITVTTEGAEDIEGDAAGLLINANGMSITLQSDGSDLWII